MAESRSRLKLRPQYVHVSTLRAHKNQVKCDAGRGGDVRRARGARSWLKNTEHCLCTSLASMQQSRFVFIHTASLMFN